MTDLKQLALDIEYGRREPLSQEIQALLNQGCSVDTIVRDGIMSGLQEVGRKFAAQEYFLPEMLHAARAAKHAEQLLTERFGPIAPKYPQKIVLGTVQNDLHDIGKNLVKMAMQNLGMDVIDLGVDVSPEQFVRAVEADACVRFVGISALLTTTLPAMHQTVRALRACSASERICILVGGAPVTSEFARRIGADIYTKTAFEAAEAVRNLLEGDAST